ncbi:hypothetical protein [Streptomyces sp. NPDC018610]|jgi:hypothetical protein|uniref:hypothetical protein n=1 Tax=Streptomyces sp. NPDC018610 TaxID=3365049 RepID=UPI0037AE6F90
MTEQTRSLEARDEAPRATAPQAHAVVTPTPPAEPAAPVPPPAAPKERRVLRAVLRWAAAVAVFAVAGTWTAYGIIRMERTDVPGLATESDGRWDYPTLSAPPLPSGSPGPLAEDNPAGAHYADLRALVLPAPRGATEDEALRGEGGWLPAKDFLAQYAMQRDRTELGQNLTDLGLRHVAARGWTTRDGVRTRVFLLQFGTAEVAERARADFCGADTVSHELRDVHSSHLDEDFPADAAVGEVSRFAFAEDEPYGDRQVRQAYLQAGDVVALVVQSGAGAAPAVPFQQTVTLQSELLA